MCNRFLKITVQKDKKQVRAGKPPKGSRSHRSNSEAESQTCILYRSTLQEKNKLEEAFPLPYEAGECSSSGSRRPGHPLSTPWSCEKAKVKTNLTTHIMQDSTLCPRQYLHAPLLCWGALCRVSHQQGKHPPYTLHPGIRV